MVAAAGGGGGDKTKYLFREQMIPSDMFLEEINIKQQLIENDDLLKKILILDKVHDLHPTQLTLSLARSILHKCVEVDDEVKRQESELKKANIKSIFGLISVTKRTIFTKLASLPSDPIKDRITKTTLIDFKDIDELTSISEELKTRDFSESKFVKSIKIITKLLENLKLYFSLINIIQKEAHRVFINISSGIAELFHTLHSKNLSISNPEENVKTLFNSSVYSQYLSLNIALKRIKKDTPYNGRNFIIDSGTIAPFGKLSQEQFTYGSIADASTGPRNELCKTPLSINVIQNMLSTIVGSLIMHMTNLGTYYTASIISISKFGVVVLFKGDGEEKKVSISLVPIEKQNCEYNLVLDKENLGVLNFTLPLFNQAGSIISLINGEKYGIPTVELQLLQSIFGARSTFSSMNSFILRQLHNKVANKLKLSRGVKYEPMGLKTYGDFIQTGESMITTDLILLIQNMYISSLLEKSSLSFWVVGGNIQGYSYWSSDKTNLIKQFEDNNEFNLMKKGQAKYIEQFYREFEEIIIELEEQKRGNTFYRVINMIPQDSDVPPRPLVQSSRSRRPIKKPISSLLGKEKDNVFFQSVNKGNFVNRLRITLRLIILCFMQPVSRRLLNDQVNFYEIINQNKPFYDLIGKNNVTDTNAWLQIKEDPLIHSNLKDKLFFTFDFNVSTTTTFKLFYQKVFNFIAERINSTIIRRELDDLVGDMVIDLFIIE